jgi:hypothetical protein
MEDGGFIECGDTSVGISSALAEMSRIVLAGSSRSQNWTNLIACSVFNTPMGRRGISILIHASRCGWVGFVFAHPESLALLVLSRATVKASCHSQQSGE